MFANTSLYTFAHEAAVLQSEVATPTVHVVESFKSAEARVRECDAPVSAGGKALWGFMPGVPVCITRPFFLKVGCLHVCF